MVEPAPVTRPPPRRKRHRLPPLVSPLDGNTWLIRGRKVMLDSTLAARYGISAVGKLNEKFKRNPARFPEDFAFRLTREEFDLLRKWNAIRRLGSGQSRKHLPWVFTEEGAAMLSSILRSGRAAEVNVRIIRIFTALCRLLKARPSLARRIERDDPDLGALIHAAQESRHV